MFDVQVGGNYAIAGTETWNFSRDTAETFYANTCNPAPVSITCTGGGRNNVNCLTANQPATPAPAPEQNKLMQRAQADRCAFWAGGALSSTSYTTTSRVNGVNGNGNWTYTYNCSVVPNAPSFEARSAWTLASSTTTAATVTLAGTLQGQSALLKSAKSAADWNYKLSHEMSHVDELTGEAVADLVDPVATITDSNGSIVSASPLAFTLEQGVDYFYSANAGTFGATGLLVNDANVSVIQTGLAAATDGYVDNFAGNDTTLGERAVLTPAEWTFTAPGDYTLTVSGTLKGNTGAVTRSISVTSSATIFAGDCQP
jgi:hypothetical protein